MGAGGTSHYPLSKFDIGGGQAVDLNVFISAVIYCILITAMMYLLIVLPYNALRKRDDVKPSEVESLAEVELLTQIRDLLAAQRRRKAIDRRRADPKGVSPRPGRGLTP